MMMIITIRDTSALAPAGPGPGTGDSVTYSSWLCRDTEL